MSGTGEVNGSGRAGPQGAPGHGLRRFSEEVPTSDGREREQLWRDDRIDALLNEHDGGVLFISGCVANQGRFYPRFDAVVLLSAPVDLILERLAVRKTNDFGKTDAERDLIVQDLATFEQLLRTTSTAEIDTRRRSTRSSMRSSTLQTRSPAKRAHRLRRVTRSMSSR